MRGCGGVGPDRRHAAGNLHRGESSLPSTDQAIGPLCPATSLPTCRRAHSALGRPADRGRMSAASGPVAVCAAGNRGGVAGHDRLSQSRGAGGHGRVSGLRPGGQRVGKTGFVDARSPIGRGDDCHAADRRGGLLFRAAGTGLLLWTDRRPGRPAGGPARRAVRDADRRRAGAGLAVRGGPSISWRTA